MLRQILSALLITTSLLDIYLICYAAKRRTFPGAVPFILIGCCIIVYSSGYFFEIQAQNLAQIVALKGISHLVIPILPCLWLFMCADYVRISKTLKKAIKFLLPIYPAFHYFAFYTNSRFHLYIRSYRLNYNGYFYTALSQKGVLYSVNSIIALFMGIVCFMLIVKGLYMAPKKQRSSYIIILVASLSYFSTFFLNVTSLNPLNIDYFPLVSIIPSLLYMNVIFQNSFFNTIPLATEDIYKKSGTGIALIDYFDRLIDENEAFKALFPAGTGKCAYSFDFIKQLYPELSALSIQNTPVYFARTVDDTCHSFQASLSEFSSDQGFIVGRILEIKDVTQFTEHILALEQAAAAAINRAETSEISFLQAQISPHFVNNTLSAISCFIDKDREKAKELVADLGEYLFNSYHISESPTVRLWQELEAVDTYLRIEKARFGNRLCFDLQCNAAPDLELPKLVIQPLVENAVKHGLMLKPEGGHIALRVIASSEGLFVEVQDDGVGMSPEKLGSLLDERACDRGVALCNINSRLVKYYGTGLSILSETGIGTSVTFSIPISSEKINGGANVC
jgi:two-component system, LytTR family, sensor kinase